MYEEDNNTQSRSWFYVTAGILCALLAANVTVADLFLIWFWVQQSGVTIS